MFITPWQRRSTHGFTLVELLVVIAIIGVLVSMLLPAVQRAREVASSANCQNNLHQLALAFHLHHDAHRFFPSGGDFRAWPSFPAGGQPFIGKDQTGSWLFQLLPYLEAHSIWACADLEKIKSTPNALFLCPSRGGPRVVVGGWGIGNARLDYGASNQDGPDTNDGSFNVGTGVVRRNTEACVRTTDIRDGLADTILIGERRLCLAVLGNAGDDDHGYSIGWDIDTVSRTDMPPDADPSTNCYFGGIPTWNGLMGSSHTGSFNAAFADGSVRPVAYSIAPGVFQRMGHIADN